MQKLPRNFSGANQSMKINSRHDFRQSTADAAKDQVLQTWLLKQFKTTQLLSADAAGLAETARDILDCALKFGRERYSSNAERVCAVISASTVDNALAVQATRDWVVISEALLVRLFAVSEKLGPTLMTETGLDQTEIGRTISTLPPMNGGFTSAVSSLLFSGAVAFFAGHEIGHHLEGGLSILGTAATGDLVELPQNEVEQALEIGADERGVIISRQVMAYYLGKCINLREYTDAEKVEYQMALALLLSVGLFLSMAVIRPRSIGMKDITEKQHPPGSLRVLLLSMHLSHTVKQTFSLISDRFRRHIRLVALDMAAAASIEPGTKPAILTQERAGTRSEPLGLRAVGLRRAIYDPDLRHYARRLLETREKLRPQLVPR
jgi:hypothetical protein